jgi:hypothetical protein
MRRHWLGWAATLLVLAVPANALAPKPSRSAVKDCVWQRFSNPQLGLEAWVQHCDFGARKIDFRVQNQALFVHYSDGNFEQPVIHVFDLKPGETVEAGIHRIWAQHTDARVAARCVIERYTEGKTPSGVVRYTFVPDKAYQKQLDARHEDGVPDPPCGDWGTAPDGIQYFEAQPASGARRFLFVECGQDEPLFDDATLHLLPTH